MAAGSAFAVWAYARASDERLTRAQISSCERVNALRRSFNTRGEAIDEYVHAALPDSPPRDRPALHHLAAAFARIPIVDCSRVVRAGTGS